MTKAFLEAECERLAYELIAAKRTKNPKELTFWLTYFVQRGYNLGYYDSNDNKPYNPPETKEIPKL